MVLVPGAAVLGRDEPRLKALARTFARAWLCGAGAGAARGAPPGQLSRADAERVASAMRYLAGPRATACRAAVAAVSYAVAPAIIAALQEDLAPRQPASSSASAATATPNPSSASSPAIRN